MTLHTHTFITKNSAVILYFRPLDFKLKNKIWQFTGLAVQKCHNLFIIYGTNNIYQKVQN